MVVEWQLHISMFERPRSTKMEAIKLEIQDVGEDGGDDVGDGDISVYNIIPSSANNEDSSEIYGEFAPHETGDGTAQPHYFRISEFDGFCEPAQEEIVLQTAEEEVVGVVDDGLVYIMNMPDGDEQFPLNEEEEIVYADVQEVLGEEVTVPGIYDRKSGKARKKSPRKARQFQVGYRGNDDEYSEAMWMTSG